MELPEMMIGNGAHQGRVGGVAFRLSGDMIELVALDLHLAEGS